MQVPANFSDVRLLQPIGPLADLGGYVNAAGLGPAFPLDAVRRPNTPIWKLDAGLNCWSCRTLRYSPPVHVTKLTEIHEIVL